MLKDAWRRFHDLVVRLEELPWGPGAVLGLLAGIIAVRNLLEITLARNPVFPALAAFVHYPLAYVGPAIALVLVLSALARVAPARVMRLMVLAWLLTLVPPVADLLLHPGRETPTIAYLQADPSELGWILLHFFDPRVSLVGTTAGIRLEALAAVLLGALYVGLRSGRWWRALVAMPAIYGTSLFFFALPVLVYGAFRARIPGLTRDMFAHGEGILFRVDPANGLDPLAVTWLVPVLLFLGLAWRRLETRHEERWLAASPPGSPAPWPECRPAVLLPGAALAGILAGVLLWFPPNAHPPRAAWDTMGTIACLLAIPLLLGAIRALGERRFVPGGGLLLLGTALLAALGTPTAVPLAAAAGTLLPFAAAALPPRGGLRWAGLAVSLALATLAAFAAGFALVIGPDALARIPRELFLPVLAWGALAAILAELGARFAPRPALRPVVPIVLALAGILVTAGFLSDDEVRPALHREVHQVARLARIRGEKLLGEGNLDRARGWLRTALRYDPDDAVAHRHLGLVYVRKGRTDRALEEFRRAVELAPDDPANLANLASLLVQQDRAAEALELLDRALRLAPRDVTVLFNRAAALDALGRAEAAREAWRRYLAIAGPRPEEADGVRHARRRLRALGDSPPS